MTSKYTQDSNHVFAFSKEEAHRLHNDKVLPVHLLLAILRLKGSQARKLLCQMAVDLTQMKQQLEACAVEQPTANHTEPASIEFDESTQRVIRLCALEARQMQQPEVDTHHILAAILRAGDNQASQVLEESHVAYDELHALINPTHTHHGSLSDHDDDFDDDDDTMDTPGPEREQVPQATVAAPSNGDTPVLDNFCTDLTRAAQEGLLDPVIGRDAEIARVAQILSRRKKNNPILIGLPGAGKSAIVEGLALRIAQHRVCRHLWGKRVLSLDLACVVAGTKYRGQFEERIRNIVQELQRNPHIIIFIDEIHTMVGAGSASGSMDAANMLKPALSRGEIQCIGATTTSEFRKTIEKDGALDRRFQKVMVEPTTAQETLQILQQLQSRYEQHHHVRYTPQAIEACVKLTERYVADRCFPDKAIDAMDEAGSRVHIQDLPVSHQVQTLEKKLAQLQEKKVEAVKRQNFELAADYRDEAKRVEALLAKAQQEWEESLSDEVKQVTEAQVAQVVSQATGIPVQRISTQEHQRLRELAHTLGQSVIGQEEAIATVARAIQRSRTGIKDPQRPIATFMFVGPTGVGKTHLTKVLAREMFGSPGSIIRIDMSEYMEKHTVSRMVGAPPGYVGYEEGGQLTERVRRKPYSIVLLDEIEKAHTDVFNILLQVMDEGRLTDSNGATVDFKNTIVIMTSNCGTRQIKEFGRGMGFATPDAAGHNRQVNRSIVDKALQKQFSPEFLNRIDSIIHFDQLSATHIHQILQLELKPLVERMKDLGHPLEVSPQAMQLLANKGYDVQYGARPVKRAIQNLLEDPLCQALMEPTLQPGTTLRAEAKDNTIEIITK